MHSEVLKANLDLIVKHLSGQHDQRTHGRRLNRVEVLRHAADSLKEENRMMRLILKEGGFTLDPVSARKVKHGYAVGAVPEESFVDAIEKVTPERIAKWTAKHAKELAAPGIKIGGWWDKDTDKVWLDIVKVFPNSQRENAIAFAREKNQIAIFHIDTGEVIYVGGTGVAKAGRKDRFVLFVFDPDTSPEEMAARMRAAALVSEVKKHLRRSL